MALPRARFTAALRRSWPREHPCQPDEALLKRGIADRDDASHATLSAR